MAEQSQKILITVTKGSVGGAQMSVLNLARELKRRGRDVTVGFGEGEFLADGCRRFSVPVRRFKSLKRGTGILSNLSFIFELRHFLKENGFSVLHINSSNALFGALSAFSLFRKRPRVVFTYRGMSILDEKYEMSRFKRFFYISLFNLFMIFVDKQVFVSKANLKSAKAMDLGSSGVVIYNGLDMNELSFKEKDRSRAELEHACGVSLEGKTVIGSIGRLAYQKNYEFLVRNWSEIKERYPDAVCTVIGDGPDREGLLSKVEEEGIEESFFFAGEITDAARLLRAFDIFTLPSRYEGLSITTIEALFASVPMLITKTGGNPEVLGSSEEFLFEVDADGEFKEKLFAILESDELKERARSVSFKEAYRFSISETANGYEAVYKNGKK